MTPTPEPLNFYHDTRTEPFTFLLGEDFIEKHNIAWRVELAQEEPSNPIMETMFPWESACVFSHGTIMLDPTDGLWKAWYIAVPEHKFSPSAERRLCYAESKDGLNWDRPLLDLHSYGDHAQTNILLSIESGGPCQHASVIVHPDAEPSRRYEMFIMRLPGWECGYNVVEGFPLPEDRATHAKKDKDETVFGVGLYRYTSADGKLWEPWVALDVESSDSGWVSQLADGTYVMYHKIAIPALPGGVIPYDVAAGRCRIMMRRTSLDGTNWSPAELTMTPDWQDAQDTQFMELSPFPQKGGDIGLVSIYHLLNQTVDIQFAGSRDGKSWWRPDRRPCLPLRPLGDTGGGMVWPMHPLIQHEGRIYLYYAGCEGVHNDYMSTEPLERMRAGDFPFWPHYYQAMPQGNDVYCPMPGNVWYYSSLCRASWEEGRLWGAVTASGGNLYGDMLTRELKSSGQQVTVNVVTVRDGSLEAEWVLDGQPIPGFTRADCTVVQGDHRAALVTWTGGDVCPVEKAQLRFFIRRARLYGFDLQAATSASD